MGNCQMCEGDKATDREEDWTADKAKVEGLSKGLSERVGLIAQDLRLYLDDDMMFMRNLRPWVGRVQAVQDLQLLVHASELLMRKSAKGRAELPAYRQALEALRDASYNADIPGDAATQPAVQRCAEFILKLLYVLVRHEDADDNKLISEVGDSTENLRKALKDAVAEALNVMVANEQLHSILTAL